MHHYTLMGNQNVSHSTARHDTHSLTFYPAVDDGKMQRIDLSSDESIYRIENLPPTFSHIVKCDTRATRELINRLEHFLMTQ